MANFLKTLAAVLVALELQGVVAAGSWLQQHKQCPPGEYCCLHIQAPTAYRFCAYAQKPGSGKYGLDVAPRAQFGAPVRFPCPGVYPPLYPYAGLFPSAAIAPFPAEEAPAPLP